MLNFCLKNILSFCVMYKTVFNRRKQFNLLLQSSLSRYWWRLWSEYSKYIQKVQNLFRGLFRFISKGCLNNVKNFSVLQSLCSFCLSMYYWWNFVCADKCNVLCADICKLWLLPKPGILTCINSGWRLWLGRRFTWKQWTRVLSRYFVSSVMKLSKNVNLVVGYG